MAKKKLRGTTHHSDLQYFRRLAPYIAKVSTGSLGRHQIFSLCVRASLCKCYEFNLAARGGFKPELAFFTISSLRGICEDLIVLRFIEGLPPADRRALISALIGYETATRIRLQDIFFAAVRPQQPVLRLKEADAKISASQSAAQAIWRRHGWPNLKTSPLPQIRQIAEKQGVPLLSVLYDYLYRLTSAGVHFSVQSLLRSGWGSSPNVFHFSTKNFPEYYSSYCSAYGAFLFCLYFEFFSSILRPDSKVSALVTEIRKDLLFTPRWPEMVTFEEMNMKAPDYGNLGMIMSAFQAVARKRLVTRGVDYTKKSSAEARLVRAAFKHLASAQPLAKPTQE